MPLELFLPYKTDLQSGFWYSHYSKVEGAILIHLKKCPRVPNIVLYM